MKFHLESETAGPTNITVPCDSVFIIFLVFFCATVKQASIGLNLQLYVMFYQEMQRLAKITCESLDLHQISQFDRVVNKPRKLFEAKIKPIFD